MVPNIAKTPEASVQTYLNSVSKAQAEVDIQVQLAEAECTPSYV